MARMHPHVLPRGSTNSSAEEDIHALLADALPDDWEVFHSAGLVIRDERRGTFNDEVDFVLCHPDEGILCLEVKGGHFEVTDGQFVRIKRGGVREAMPNPYRQALDHWHNFLRLLMKASSGESRRWFIGYGLAFPNQDVPDGDLLPEAPRALTLDRAECFRDIGAGLERTLAYNRGIRDRRTAPGSRALDLVRSLFAPTIKFAESLGGRVAADDYEIRQLTESQRKLLHGLGNARRVAVRGMAGTGKTVLAVERCRELRRRRRSVAYVCFTRGLAVDLSSRFGADVGTISTFHKLCSDAARTQGIRVAFAGGASPPPEYWSDHLPAALVEACERSGGLFDDIVVDEAQDLTDDYLAALALALRDEETGSLWLFGDDNQKVFRRGVTMPDGFVPYELTENFRNTQSIHANLIPLYEGASDPICIGPLGRPVEWIEAEDEATALRDLVVSLIDGEGVPPEDLTVLSPFPLETSRAAAAAVREGGFFWYSAADRGVPKTTESAYPRVRFESIKAFKGLEAPVVLLCDVDFCIDRESERAELYVALSRARTHCIALGSRGCQERFDALVERGASHADQAGSGLAPAAAANEQQLVRVYEIARSQGLPDAAVIRRLRQAGFAVGSPAELVDRERAMAALLSQRGSVAGDGSPVDAGAGS